MTPGWGVGANTALRDAALLCRNLTAARDGRTTILQAIHDYERRMIAYGFDAVEKSRAQMDGNAPLHKPVIRTRRPGRDAHEHARLVNHLPPAKKRMAETMMRYRGSDREDDAA